MSKSVDVVFLEGNYSTERQADGGETVEQTQDNGGRQGVGPYNSKVSA